jgi:hypothetical protein
MKLKTKKKQKRIKHKIMPMIKKQNKRTPANMILGLIYLDMLHHIQPQNDKELIEKQRDILKPFIKKEKNKTNKITKITKTSKVKRGGHVFYYNVLPAICGVDVHENDCVPSTLHFLGLLTYEAARYLALERGEGLDYRSILQWLDENFDGERNPHVAETILDLRDYFLDTNQDGWDIYDEEAIDAANDAFMDKLTIILPYTQMGVIAGSVKYSEDNNQEYEGGHVFCIIKDEYEQLRIIDPQQRRNIPLYSIHDAVQFLKSGTRMYELVLYIQQDVLEQTNANSPEIPNANNFIVPDPTAFNVERILNINKEYNEENGNNEYGNENNEYGNEYGNTINHNGNGNDIHDNANGNDIHDNYNGSENNGYRNGNNGNGNENNGTENVRNGNGNDNNGNNSGAYNAPYPGATWDEWNQRWYN